MSFYGLRIIPICINQEFITGDNMKAVILAGGKGTRLKPYTTCFPKPLMPIGEEPILEIVVKQLKCCGFNEIIMAVGHLAELIKVFFNNGNKYDLKIGYYREDKPLGTAGPLAQLKNEIDDDFLMMNGDILTDLDYSQLIRSHEESDAIATISLKQNKVPIDFGVVELNKDSNIVGYSEKPKIDYLVSMGIYAFSPRIFEYISPNKYLDIPDLIKMLISAGEKVNGYVYDGYWLDIGRPDDYEKANEDLNYVYNQIYRGKNETDTFIGH
jgi:NDP-sugar pyrophosphorylase family protein